MTSGPSIDGVLVQWGERLFYPGNRIVKTPPTPRLDTMMRRKAGVIRKRIEAIAVRRAPQVMVKVTGGGRGMGAIAAHFRYISKQGRLLILHEHQANPHVHLSVRAESSAGKRLNPRKTDLHRWRETFAEKLRGWGIDAEATRQATRGVARNYEPLWRQRAREEGRLRRQGAPSKTGLKQAASRSASAQSWAHILRALATSESMEDRQLAEHVAQYVKGIPAVREYFEQHQVVRSPERQRVAKLPRDRQPGREGPDIGR